jgi:hypothetical protein
MNASMERWVRTCRTELLDRTLIYNQRHLLHALREYEHFYNLHRPHQGIANARPLTPLPEPMTDPDRLGHLTFTGMTASTVSCANTSTPPDPPGRNSLQVQGWVPSHTCETTASVRLVSGVFPWRKLPNTPPAVKSRVSGTV